MREISEIKTAVSEAVTNAIVHGYRGCVGTVELIMRQYPGGLFYICVRDKGAGIQDVEQAMTPLFTTAPEEERSGLGFSVMESFMDRVSVRSAPGKGTSVTMEKRISAHARPRRAGKVRKAGEPRVTRDEFIEGNLPLVHKLANRFRGRGVEYEELYAAGCVGLVKAVDRFEPERGLCFSTYAVPVILGEIRRLFRDGGSVKISRSLKELSVKAARLRDQLSANGEPRISDIAQALGVTPEEAAEALCAGIPPVSLDHGGEDGEPLPVPSASGEDALIDRLALRQCLSELSGEDREILMLRYFRRKTQCETAQILGMTQVMVSRRERKLLKELREQLV